MNVCNFMRTQRNFMAMLLRTSAVPKLQIMHNYTSIYVFCSYILALCHLYFIGGCYVYSSTTISYSLKKVTISTVVRAE